MAEALGYHYTGIEIRQQQVEANRQQGEILGYTPEYIVGDSTKTLELIPEQATYDLVFTCPPYYDLEIYSDVLEGMVDMSVYRSYLSFMLWYEVVFRQSVARLRPNRFLVVVVSDIRDKNGIYRGFVADNIACFKKLGLQFYNEGILITAAGSLPIRVGKQFTASRKLGRSHQNILVFYKGNVNRIKAIDFAKVEENHAGEEN